MGILIYIYEDWGAKPEDFEEKRVPEELYKKFEISVNDNEEQGYKAGISNTDDNSRPRKMGY